MHFTLMVAGALIPDELSPAITASLSIPNLKARLARARMTVGNELSNDGNAHLDWLAREMFSQTPAPTAPYAYAHLCGNLTRAFLWHADPVHIEVARDHLIVNSLDSHAPSEEESTQLIDVANRLMSGHGCELVRARDQWFLQCEHDWAINARPLAAAVGQPVAIPSGADALMWNRLHNEIQMAWHTLPFNQKREDRQEPRINGIWLHGGARWKPLASIRYAQVHADEPELQGAAVAAGARAAALNAEMSDGSLLVVSETAEPRKLHDWSAWSRSMAVIDRMLTGHERDSIELVLCGRTVRTFRWRPSDAYAFWRQRSLAEALAE